MKFSLSLGENKQGHQLTEIMTSHIHNFKKISFLFLDYLKSYLGKSIKPDVMVTSTT